MLGSLLLQAAIWAGGPVVLDWWFPPSPPPPPLIMFGSSESMDFNSVDFVKSNPNQKLPVIAELIPVAPRRLSGPNPPPPEFLTIPPQRLPRKLSPNRLSVEFFPEAPRRVSGPNPPPAPSIVTPPRKVSPNQPFPGFPSTPFLIF